MKERSVGLDWSFVVVVVVGLLLLLTVIPLSIVGLIICVVVLYGMVRKGFLDGGGDVMGIL